MKIIGQPDSYSDILERVFATTLASGVACTAILAHASPAFRTFLESLSTTADVGPLRGIRALYVVIPLLVAILSRAIRLHDRISDILRLRHRFDVQHILLPLAIRSGFPPTDKLRERLDAQRRETMYAVFYPYAGFSNPVIDRQLVRTAADNWGWFWVSVEAAFVCLLTVLILTVLGAWRHVAWMGGGVFALLAFATSQWFVCRRGARYQVDEIAKDAGRADVVRRYFAKLTGTTIAPHPDDALISYEVAGMGKSDKWDAFICHASEDKAAVVEPLAAELRRRGVKIWYDKWVLRIGDSLRRKVDEGLGNSRYGIVVLSPDFFRKEWPQHELDGLVQREIDGRKVILPIWHNISRAEVIRYSVTLADKLAGSTAGGIDALAEELEAVIRS